MTSTVEVRAHAPVTPPEDGDELASASIGPLGELVALWSDAAGCAMLMGRTTEPSGVRYPDAVTPRPVRCRASVQDPALRRVTPLGVDLANVLVQPLPEDRLLVAAARCPYYDDTGPGSNAAVYDDTGSKTATGVLGDGIAHLLTTASGDVWAGYFDEGVYGNFGWGRSPDREPLGAPGIVRYTADLTRAWEFPGDGDAPPVDDVYALNVTDTAVHTCYYGDFPFVRIEQGTVDMWRNPIGAASAVLVGAAGVALVGGYGERDRVVLAHRVDGELTPYAERRLTLPGGAALPRGLELVARGDELHLLSDTHWWKVSLDQIARAG